MTAEQLKNSILQMAVSGKLVPQDPNDEPASVLLKRIRKEKEQLIKEGKIKKEKNPSYIFRGADNTPYEKVGNNDPISIVDELPFEIPESWEWCRLGSLMSVISDGTHKTPVYVDKGIPFLSVQNISKGYFDFTKLKYITEEEHQRLIQRIQPQINDILFCRIGTLGKAIKCTLDFEFSIFVSLGLLRPIDSELADYIVFAINSPLGDRWIQDNKVGGGTHTYKINLVDIPNMLVPIPPLAEQKRIFSKMADLKDSLKAYESAESQVLELDNRFPEQLKKSILQMAVQGKLVDQDPNDEPATVLLERIRAEKERLINDGKIKRDKNESVIYRRDNSHYEKLDGGEQCIDDEIPFEIPASWEWQRLRSIAELQTGTTPPTGNRDYFGSGFPFIKPGDISPSGIDYCNEALTELGSKKSRLIPQESVLMVCIGGSIGKCYYTDRDVCCNQQINAASPIFINHKYLWVVLSNDYVYKRIIATAGGTATPIINKSLWGELLIPIPPLNEQAHIVSIVETLEASIKIL